jgi:hypothetical protein
MCIHHISIEPYVYAHRAPCTPAMKTTIALSDDDQAICAESRDVRVVVYFAA